MRRYKRNEDIDMCVALYSNIYLVGLGLGPIRAFLFNHSCQYIIESH